MGRARMKSLLALLALGLLCVGIAACGGSSKPESGSANSASASTGTTVHVDTTSPAVASPSAHPDPVRKVSRRDLEKYDRDEDDYIEVPDDHNPAPVGFTPAD